MKKIDNFASIEGRLLLQEIFKELRYEKQQGSFSVVRACFGLCVNSQNIEKYVDKEIKVLHNLGFFRGLTLWLEEIVNRYYFSTFNSFVYFGAAVLLSLIGIRRFSDNVNDTMVLWGVGFEAAMLLMMFFVMLFTPDDSITEDVKQNAEKDDYAEDIITEVGEIARDFAAAVVSLEKISDTMAGIANRQEYLIDSVKAIAQSSSDAVNPNPEMIKQMKETNIALSDFKNVINDLNSSVKELRKEEIEIVVRKEIEKIISSRAK